MMERALLADLAAKLRAFASDAVVVKHLITFALPTKKRASAVAITKHTSSIGALSVDDTTKPGNKPRSTCDATEHTRDNNGDDEQAHD